MVDDKIFLQGQNGDLIRFDLITYIRKDLTDPQKLTLYAETINKEKFIIYQSNDAKDFDKQYAYLIRCLDII